MNAAETLSPELRQSPVHGRTDGGQPLTSTLGEVLEPGPTLLFFLRHLG